MTTLILQNSVSIEQQIYILVEDMGTILLALNENIFVNRSFSIFENLKKTFVVTVLFTTTSRHSDPGLYKCFVMTYSYF